MGIMEDIKNFSPMDTSVIGNPAVESEIVMNALRSACASDEEFAALLESAGTEMALYGLLSDENIATEVVKKIQVNDWKTANFNRICRRTAIRLAMINNDALYTKYRKYRDLLLEVREKIYVKYQSKAKSETRRIIKNARNKAASMNSAAGRSITEKMDQQIAEAESKK
jgi:hypothetical protein